MTCTLREIDENDLEEQITEIYGTFEVCSIKFDAGRILREVDPIAFQCALNDEPEAWVCDECSSEHETEEDGNNCCPPDEDATTRTTD